MRDSRNDDVSRSPRLFVVNDDPPTGCPPWFAESLLEFRRDVGNTDYPCYFGYRALRDGELFATWVGRGESGANLAADLQEFLDATRPFPNRRMVLAAFFAPEPPGHSHEWYGDRFWAVLSELGGLDNRPRPAGYPESPQDPKWEFTFGGEAMFVFAASPTHVDRRSRRLGPGLVMLFQPRNVFHRIEGGTPGGTVARRRIRAKLTDWDAAPAHPAMGDYGDAANFEWKQYYIADHERPMRARCPLDPAAGLLLHEMVSDQARRTPDAVAVIAGDRTLDYLTLDRSSNELAADLVAKGVRPDDRLAIMADRSADTVVSMLAILKAGASYLPLDPNYPEDRRAYLLDDAGVDIVLTPRRLVSSVPVGPRWLLLSDDPPRDGGQHRPRPETTARPDNLAYVIYTSGSTGTPKGVAVSHRQIVHSTHVQYAVERPWPEAFLMPISFSFDASAVGIYWPLTTGGCVVLPREGEHRDPDRLRSLISRYGITHIDCTPSLYDLILGDDASAVRSLTCVQVGGEVCPPHLVARHRSLLPDCVFENNYGPTEATIWTTTNVMRRDSPLPTGSVPIGHALPGATVYLLDDELRPVGPHQPGEVYVGGEGVARGYLNRPALTAQRFVPDPFTGRSGARMYRTGDIARQLDGGALDFVGRSDAQVKVRGYRIELGEIETALRSHPDVAEAVVAVRSVAGEPTLVGFLQPRQPNAVTDLAIVGYLSARLPDHMVPRRYVPMERMPRTVSGKVDYPRLPELSVPVQARGVTTLSGVPAGGAGR